MTTHTLETSEVTLAYRCRPPTGAPLVSIGQPMDVRSGAQVPVNAWRSEPGIG
jgi:hypothetical protein